MVLENIMMVAAVATVVHPVDTSLIVGIMDPVVHFVLQVNTAGTSPTLLLALRLFLQLIC